MPYGPSERGRAWAKLVQEGKALLPVVFDLWRCIPVGCKD